MSEPSSPGLDVTQEIRYRLAATSHVGKGLSVLELQSQLVLQAPDMPVREFALLLTTVDDAVVKRGVWYLTKPPGRFAPKPTHVEAWGNGPARQPGTVIKIIVSSGPYYGVIVGRSEYDGCTVVERWTKSDAGEAIRVLWDVHHSRCEPIDAAAIPDAVVREAVEQSSTILTPAKKQRA